MAVYKVPQDVEADDKLIGPFSFRQFIYLVIAVIAIALGWGLSQLFIPLAIIPLPIVLLFGALALPLRKDQPMEIYLAAVVSFYLKPRKRMWEPDGIQSLVEITAPRVQEIERTKNLSEDEARKRLSYLADIVDTGGWSVRGVAAPQSTNSMQSDAYYEAQQTEDILDDDGGVSRNLNSMISQADARRKEELVARLHQPSTINPTPTPLPAASDPYATLAPSQAAQAPAADDWSNLSSSAAEPHLMYSPYPTAIHQAVIQPIDPSQAIAAPPPQQPAPQPQAPVTDTPQLVQLPQQPVAAPQQIAADNMTPATSAAPVSPGIMNLVNNSDLSVETIAREAQRIHQKEAELSEDEVVISLR